MTQVWFMVISHGVTILWVIREIFELKVRECIPWAWHFFLSFYLFGDDLGRSECWTGSIKSQLHYLIDSTDRSWSYYTILSLRPFYNVIIIIFVGTFPTSAKVQPYSSSNRSHSCNKWLNYVQLKVFNVYNFFSLHFGLLLRLSWRATHNIKPTAAARCWDNFPFN